MLFFILLTSKTIWWIENLIPRRNYVFLDHGVYWYFLVSFISMICILYSFTVILNVQQNWLDVHFRIMFFSLLLLLLLFSTSHIFLLCSGIEPNKKQISMFHKKQKQKLAINMMFYRWFQWYITVCYSKCGPAKNWFNPDHTNPWFEFRLSNVFVLFYTAYTR